MTTNEQKIAVTLLVGSKVYTLMETVAKEDWEQMSRAEQEHLKDQLRLRLAESFSNAELMRQMQTYVTEDQPTAVTYKVYAGPAD